MGNSVSGLLWGEEEGRPSEGANKGGQDAILPLTQKKRSLELEDAEEQRLLARKRLEFMQLAVEQFCFSFSSLSPLSVLLIPSSQSPSPLTQLVSSFPFSQIGSEGGQRDGQTDR